MERGQASFNSRELTFFMDGGESITKVKANLMPITIYKFFLDERSHDVRIRKRSYI